MKMAGGMLRINSLKWQEKICKGENLMVFLWNSEKCDKLNDLDVDYVRHKLLDRKNLELDVALLIPTIGDMRRLFRDWGGGGGGVGGGGGGGGGGVGCGGWRVERGERNKSTESFSTSSEGVEGKMKRLTIFFHF